jgi:hypothetical protein
VAGEIDFRRKFRLDDDGGGFLVWSHGSCFSTIVFQRALTNCIRG